MYQHVSIYCLRQKLFSFYWVKEMVALIKYKSDFPWYRHFMLTAHTPQSYRVCNQFRKKILENNFGKIIPFPVISHILCT